MRVVERCPPCIIPKRTVDQAVQEKIKVLEDFCIVDFRNREEVEQKLYDAVSAEPNSNFDLVLDRVAHSMIMNRLDK